MFGFYKLCLSRMNHVARGKKGAPRTEADLTEEIQKIQNDGWIFSMYKCWDEIGTFLSFRIMEVISYKVDFRRRPITVHAMPIVSSMS